MPRPSTTATSRTPAEQEAIADPLLDKDRIKCGRVAQLHPALPVPDLACMSNSSRTTDLHHKQGIIVLHLKEATPVPHLQIHMLELPTTAHEPTQTIPANHHRITEVGVVTHLRVRVRVSTCHVLHPHSLASQMDRNRGQQVGLVELCS
jgi:hypothetical protein